MPNSLISPKALIPLSVVVTIGVSAHFLHSNRNSLVIGQSQLRQHDAESRPLSSQDFPFTHSSPSDIAAPPSEALVKGTTTTKASANTPQLLITQLENLSEQAGKETEFRELLISTFVKPGSKELQKVHLQAGIQSGDQKIQDIARSLSFLNQVQESGFSEALDQAEETLSFEGDEEDFLDFIADEVAPQNRPATLEWLREQGPDLWEDALPLVLGDWAVEAPQQVGAWISGLPANDFRDRAIAEYAPVIAPQGAEQSRTLVSQIVDADIRQEARIRTGELNFSVLGKKP